MFLKTKLENYYKEKYTIYEIPKDAKIIFLGKKGVSDYVSFCGAPYLINPDGVWSYLFNPAEAKR